MLCTCVECEVLDMVDCSWHVLRQRWRTRHRMYTGRLWNRIGGIRRHLNDSGQRTMALVLSLCRDKMLLLKPQHYCLASEGL